IRQNAHINVGSVTQGVFIIELIGSSFYKTCPTDVNRRFRPCTIRVFLQSNGVGLMLNLPCNQLSVVHNHWLMIFFSRKVQVVSDGQPWLNLQLTFGPNVIFSEIFVTSVVNTILIEQAS